ncbi:doublesex- and mab-3-related transcription factor C2-like [Crocuta crocuta]
MDPNEMPAVPCWTSDPLTGLETGAPWGIELGPKRTVSRCARCYNHGLDEQIKDQEHSCPFQACECHKCAFFSEILPAESALKREQGACLKRHLTQGLIMSGASPPKAHSHVQKLTIQGGVVSKHPKRSADWSGPKIFVSILDSSSLEDATDNFSFQEDPQDLCPVQHAPVTSDQDSISASSEWQRKLEAAEALLMLRNSSQASSGSIPLLQPCTAAAPAGDRGLQPSSPSL